MLLAILLFSFSPLVFPGELRALAACFETWMSAVPLGQLAVNVGWGEG